MGRIILDPNQPRGRYAIDGTHPLIKCDKLDRRQCPLFRSALACIRLRRFHSKKEAIMTDIASILGSEADQLSPTRTDVR